MAREGREGWWGLYSYHRYIHLVPATTTTTTLLQLRGLSTRCRQLGPGNKSSRYDIIIKIINGNMRNIFFGESYLEIDCLNLQCSTLWVKIEKLWIWESLSILILGLHKVLRCTWTCSWLLFLSRLQRKIRREIRECVFRVKLLLLGNIFACEQCEQCTQQIVTKLF